MNIDYICGSSTLIWMNGRNFGLVPIYCHRVIGDNKCPRCSNRRCVAVENKISENSIGKQLFTQSVSANESRRILNHLRKNDGWFAKFPADGDLSIMVTTLRGPTQNLFGDPFPDSPEERHLLIVDYLNATPPGRHISFSREDKSLENEIGKSKCMVLTAPAKLKTLRKALSDAGYIGTNRDDQLIYSIDDTSKMDVVNKICLFSGITFSMVNKDVMSILGSFKAY